MTQTSTLKITPVTHTTDLFTLYRSQQEPQDCYVALDTRDGALWASSNGEIGNAVPSNVWHGIVRRYEIPALQASTANALMAAIAPLAERVVAGSEVVWNGNNHVATFSADARAAEEAIEALCADEECDVYWYDANEWYHSSDSSDPLDPRARIAATIEAGQTLDETVDEIVNSTDEDGTEESPFLVGLYEYVRYHAEAAYAEAENRTPTNANIYPHATA